MLLSERFCIASMLFFVMCSITTVLPVFAVVDPRFELDMKTLGDAKQSGEKSKAVKPSKKRPVKSRPESPAGISGNDSSVYIVRVGDNLFKILKHDYGFSDDEAEKGVNLICRENNIADIRRLKVGQKIVIPFSRRVVGKSNRTLHSLPADKEIHEARGLALRMEPPDTTFSELEATIRFSRVWDKIIPPLSFGQKADMIKSAKFSLSLDPQRYPVFAGMAGGRILVDKSDSIPALVKSLIIEKNPSVHIVSESPLSGKRFLSALLDSAGFYSVEKDFSIDFGSDPKLTVYSDFKIEKSPDSLIRQDIILMNSGQISNPRVLNEFLKKEGFTVFEPFVSHRTSTAAERGKLVQIISPDQIEIIDGLLASMTIAPVKDKNLDVFAADNNGISLSVKVERYFERGGQRHIIARFDGDPVVYTLYRILEAKGYKTVILEGRDDFRKVTEKLLSSMSMESNYGQHKLGPDAGANYSIQLSGFMLEHPDIPRADLFLTNLELDRDIRDLLLDSGYRFIAK
jgi:hypothetical protein